MFLDLEEPHYKAKYCRDKSFYLLCFVLREMALKFR